MAPSVLPAQAVSAHIDSLVYKSIPHKASPRTRTASMRRQNSRSSFPILTARYPAAFRAVFIPHILEGILQATDRKTQATCLRVSRMFHAAAGPLLYRCVTLDDDTVWSLLRGSLITESHSKRASRGPPLKPTRQREQVLLDALGWSTIGSNFKAPLLSRVRVLTLGSHESAMCLYATHIAPLFRNIEVLRLAPNIHPNHEHTLRQVCDGGLGTDMCELQTGLDCQKLVFRNIDAECLLHSPGKEWNGPMLDSVVYVFPTDGRRYLHKSWADISTHFSDVKDFTIVFWPTWEPVDPGAGNQVPVSPDQIIHPLRQLVQERPRETCMECMHDMMAALDENDSDYEDEVDRIIRQATKCMCLPYHASSVAIYGLETVDFAPEGEVFTTWQATFGTAVTKQSVIAMVEEEIRSSTIGRTYAAKMTGQLSDAPSVNVKFGTKQKYLDTYPRAELLPFD